MDETTKATVIQAVLDKFDVGDDFHNDLHAQQIRKRVLMTSLLIHLVGVSLDAWKHLIDVAWQDTSHQVAQNGNLDFPKFYEDSHTSKKTNDWIHPKCGELHQKMVNLQVATTELVTPLTHEEFSRQVIGEKKKYLIGFGISPQPSIIDVS
ncbi:hypothetical protein ACSBR2_026441 [Camellia fascicularis]